MTITVSITQSNTMKLLGDFLTSILPAGIQVFQAQTNRVSEPSATDFVVMTPIMRERYETNVVSYTANTRTDLNPTKVTIQLDIHGPNSADNAQIISTLWWSAYSVEQYETYAYDITPLYNTDPHQAPFLDGEQQIEQRWTMDVIMQVNASTTVAQQTAATININLIEIDAAFKP